MIRSYYIEDSKEEQDIVMLYHLSCLNRAQISHLLDCLTREA